MPPRRVATHYLDAGHLEVDADTLDVLDAAVARTIDGIRAMAELADPVRPLEKKPGPPCSWCPVVEDCAEGQAWLEEDRVF